MRRFSQRQALVTLSDINITPLLDLAFVLLIIFVITTPMLTQSLELQLPAGGKLDKRQLDPQDVRTIEVQSDGLYRYERFKMSLPQIETELARSFQANPNLVVYIRADKNVVYDRVAAVLDRCERHNITRISLRTLPEGTR
ncbi:MAG: biopolymer transporter ExbD [Candidatus Omnitrophica bacterium]|nr:biopolymer transporter ExbD [Candidatus Omnitrophota bacterium]